MLYAVVIVRMLLAVVDVVWCIATTIPWHGKQVSLSFTLSYISDTKIAEMETSQQLQKQQKKPTSSLSKANSATLSTSTSTSSTPLTTATVMNNEDTTTTTAKPSRAKRKKQGDAERLATPQAAPLTAVPIGTQTIAASTNLEGLLTTAAAKGKKGRKKNEVGDNVDVPAAMTATTATMHTPTRTTPIATATATATTTVTTTSTLATPLTSKGKKGRKKKNVEAVLDSNVDGVVVRVESSLTDSVAAVGGGVVDVSASDVMEGERVVVPVTNFSQSKPGKPFISAITPMSPNTRKWLDEWQSFLSHQHQQPQYHQQQQLHKYLYDNNNNSVNSKNNNLYYYSAGQRQGMVSLPSSLFPSLSSLLSFIIIILFSFFFFFQIITVKALSLAALEPTHKIWHACVAAANKLVDTS